MHVFKIVWARTQAFSASNDLNHAKSLEALCGNPSPVVGEKS